MDSLILLKLKELELHITSGNDIQEKIIYKELQLAGYEEEAANMHRITYNKINGTDY